MLVLSERVEQIYFKGNPFWGAKRQPLNYTVQKQNTNNLHLQLHLLFCFNASNQLVDDNQFGLGVCELL